MVTDIDEVLTAIGLERSDIAEVVYDPTQKNNLHFIYLSENNLWLELVEPMSEDATTANFAKKHGIALHHLAIGSDDLEAAEAKYASRAGNFILGRYTINVNSFGGPIRTLFVAVRGLILEFVKVIK